VDRKGLILLITSYDDKTADPKVRTVILVLWHFLVWKGHVYKHCLKI